MPNTMNEWILAGFFLWLLVGVVGCAFWALLRKPERQWSLATLEKELEREQIAARKLEVGLEYAEVLMEHSLNALQTCPEKSVEERMELMAKARAAVEQYEAQWETALKRVAIVREELNAARAEQEQS